MIKGQDDAPEWAIEQAKAHVRKMPGYRALEMFSPNDKLWETTVEAFARYIATHEQPPVDQDTLDVRAILVEWVDHWLGSDAAQQLHEGKCDETIYFQKSLDQFRNAIATREPPLPASTITVSDEQLTKWTRDLLSARWHALGELGYAKSVRIGARDNERAFISVRNILRQILSGKRFG